MAVAQSVPQLFTSEWDRFQKGVQMLDPEAQQAWRQAAASRYGGPTGTQQINIPGFGDVFHFGPSYQPTPAERQAYSDALRGGYAPQISAEAKATLDHNRAIMQGIKNSAQPGYAQAFGTILTALDNVQDFFSSLATFGRLALWGTQLGLNSLAPGLAADVARGFAQQAALAAGREAAEGFAARVVAEAAAGNLVAKAALLDNAIFAAAKAEAIRAAEAAAAKATLARLGLGLGIRVAGRLIPIVGWIVLASDLLNVLSFFGLIATPVYALACAGPTQAIAAGIPAAVFKGALKKEAWTMTSLNPFSRSARASRAIRAAGRLPTFSNLIEVAQTTDSLFGWGISLGGLVGAFIETGFAFSAASEGKPVTVNTQPFQTDAARITTQISAKTNTAQQQAVQQAGATLANIGAILGVQDVFDEDTHLKALIVADECVGILTWALEGIDWQETFAEAMSGYIYPIIAPTPTGRKDAELAGLDLEQGRAWWFPHQGATATAEEYALYHVRAIPQAVRDFIAPRRLAPTAAVFGAYVNKITEGCFYLFERDPEILKWHFSTDWALVVSLLEEGFLIPANTPEAPLWRMWQAARQLCEEKGGRQLQLREWIELAERFKVTLMPLLPPDAPWPQEWHDYAGTLSSGEYPLPD